MAISRLHAVWLVLPALAACDDRVAQCNELVGLLNPHTEAMIRGVEDLARVESKPEAVDAWRTIVDAADRQVAAATLEDQRLAGFALRYRRQLGDAKTAGETLEQAAAQHDPAGLHRGAKQADAFLDAQATVLEELNAYCASGG